MGDWTPRVRHQERQSVELARGEMYLDSIAFDAPSNRVEGDSSVYDRHLRGSFRGTKATNRSTDSCRQLAGLKGLGHIVVGAGIQCLDLVVFTVAHRQHKNRQPGKDLPDAATGLDTSDSRHVDVEKHGFIINHTQTHESILSVARFGYIETENTKGGAQTAPQR